MIDVDNVSEKYRKRPNPRILFSFSRTIGFSRVGEEKRMLLETLRNEFHRTNLVNDARNRWMSHVDIQFTNIRITGKINSRRREGREKGGRGLFTDRTGAASPTCPIGFALTEERAIIKMKLVL